MVSVSHRAATFSSTMVLIDEDLSDPLRLIRPPFDFCILIFSISVLNCSKIYIMFSIFFSMWLSVIGCRLSIVGCRSSFRLLSYKLIVDLLTLYFLKYRSSYLKNFITYTIVVMPRTTIMSQCLNVDN